MSTTPTTTALHALLVDTLALTHYSQLYHWNVTGPHFASLHELFAEQYNELSEASDELAERLRALGGFITGGFANLATVTTLVDPVVGGSAEAQLTSLLAAHEALSTHANELQGLAAEHGDEATADMAIARIQAHDKAAWMLRSLLAN